MGPRQMATQRDLNFFFFFEQASILQVSLISSHRRENILVRVTNTFQKLKLCRILPKACNTNAFNIAFAKGHHYKGEIINIFGL